MAISVDEVECRVRERLGEQDVEAAATLVIRCFGPEILRYLHTLVAPEADAREAFSRFAENVWRGLPRFRGASSIRTWAYGLAYHAATRVHRDPFRRRAAPLSGAPEPFVRAVNDSSTGSRLTRMERTLERLRGELDEEEKTLLVLRVDRELSWSEIAQVLGDAGQPIGEAAIRKRYERLKRKLQTLVHKADLA